MGQSGAGSGGGGSGGGGGGGGGTGYAAPGRATKRDTAQMVLTRLMPDYLQRQFVGTVAPGIVRDLVHMSVDLGRGGNWRSLCERLSLNQTASLQEVREAIFAKNSQDEHDQRVRGASQTALAAFFEELTKFDDDLLVGRRKGATWAVKVDQAVLKNVLPRFLALLTENVLLREEPQMPPAKEAEALRAAAGRRAAAVVARLRERYKPSGDAGDARVLFRAAANESERTWFLSALRG